MPNSRQRDVLSQGNTGVIEIDLEISLVHEMLCQVRELRERVQVRVACDGNGSLLPECSQSLGNILSKFLNFLYLHTLDEEIVMKSCGFNSLHPNLYALHVEDHADIAQELVELIGRCSDTASVELLHHVDTLIEGWFTEHIPEHDLIFVKMVGDDLGYQH